MENVDYEVVETRIWKCPACGAENETAMDEAENKAICENCEAKFMWGKKKEE